MSDLIGAAPWSRSPRVLESDQMRQYSFIGIRVSAARQDELVEHLCELGLLPATDVPTTPIAALRGEQVFTTAFDELGAHALAFWEDRAVLAAGALCADLLASESPEEHPLDAKLRALSRGGEVVVVSAGDGGRSVRAYRDGAVIDGPGDAVHTLVGCPLAELTAREPELRRDELARRRRARRGDSQARRRAPGMARKLLRCATL